MITVHKTLKITLGDPTTMNDGDTAMDLLTIHGWALHSIFRLNDESVCVLLTKEVQTEEESVQVQLDAVRVLKGAIKQQP